LTKQSGTDDDGRITASLSDIDSVATGPDEDPESDTILEVAMRAFNAVQDFQDLKHSDVRHMRMARAVHFDDTTDNDDGSMPPPLFDRSDATDLPHNRDDDLASLPTTVNADLNIRDVQWRDPSDRLVQFLTNDPVIHISTSNDGTATCVVGDGWKVIHRSSPTRYANLVGFDANFARKRHLAIVTADSLVTTDTDEQVIIRVHEAVHNPGSATTLLSEFQMREHGIVVDSVAKTHKKDADGNFGTQSITVDADTIIPLIIRGGLMTFKFKAPTMADYDLRRIIKITKDEPSEEEFTGVSHVRTPRRNAT
jgi:hypothetical protein